MDWPIDTVVGEPTLSLLVVLLIAIAIDRWAGGPPAGGYPMAWLRPCLAWAHARIPRHSNQAAFVGGLLAWLAGAIVVVALARWLQGWLLALPWWLLPFGWLAMAWLLKSTLAWATLRDDTRAVQAALAGSLAQGRQRLQPLVDEDTSTLLAVQVNERVIEVLATRLNHWLIAPVFWYVCLGLPGAVLYSFAHLAHRSFNSRDEGLDGDWDWAGAWAARADQVLAWVPARITAGLLAWCGRLDDWSLLPDEAAQVPSVNLGWPVGAMALALDVRLCRDGRYEFNPAGRDASLLDVDNAVRFARGAARCMGLLAVVVLLLATR